MENNELNIPLNNTNEPIDKNSHLNGTYCVESLKSLNSGDSVSVKPKIIPQKKSMRIVSSRYTQAAQQYSKRRGESTEKQNRRSRNVSIERRKFIPKPILKSTPQSSEKSANFADSDISTISDPNDGINGNEINIKKNVRIAADLHTNTSVRAFRNARKSIAFTDGIGLGPMPLLPLGQDMESKSEEIMKSVLRARYLQSMVLEIQAKEALQRVEDNGKEQIMHLFRIYTQLRDESNALKEKIRSIEFVNKHYDAVKSLNLFFRQYFEAKRKIAKIRDKLMDEIKKKRVHSTLDSLGFENDAQFKNFIENRPEFSDKSQKIIEDIAKTASQVEETFKNIENLESTKSQFKQNIPEIRSLIEKLEQYKALEESLKESNE